VRRFTVGAVMCGLSRGLGRSGVIRFYGASVHSSRGLDPLPRAALALILPS